MSIKDRKIESDICEKCPARNGTLFAGRLWGSAYRDASIEELSTAANDEQLSSDHCFVIVGETVVGDVAILNPVSEKSAIEHDADFIYSVFESVIPECSGPITELSSSGLQVHCTPINAAFNQFNEVNHKEV